MTTRSNGISDELADALEQLRQIRRAADAARSNHPLRLVARPLLVYGVVLGVGVGAFGVAAQLALGRGAPLLGLPPEELVWGLALLLLAVAAVAKLAVLDAVGRRHGIDITTVLRATFTPRYLEIVVPGVATIALGCVGLHVLGGDALILGFALAGFGALVVPLGAAVALPEWGSPRRAALRPGHGRDVRPPAVAVLRTRPRVGRDAGRGRAGAASALPEARALSV